MKQPKPRGEPSTLDLIAEAGASRNRLILAIVGLFFTNLLTPLVCIYLLREPENVIIVNDQNETATVLFSGLRKLKGNADIYPPMVREIINAYGMRNPLGLDNTDAVTFFFMAQARAKLDEEIKAQAPLFTSRNYHQKVQLDENIRLTKIDDDQVLATVKIQLLRFGIVGERIKPDVVSGTLQLTLVRNRDIASNRKAPIGVWDYEFTPAR